MIGPVFLVVAANSIHQRAPELTDARTVRWGMGVAGEGGCLRTQNGSARRADVPEPHPLYARASTLSSNTFPNLFGSAYQLEVDVAFAGSLA